MKEIRAKRNSFEFLAGPEVHKFFGCVEKMISGNEMMNARRTLGVMRYRVRDIFSDSLISLNSPFRMCVYKTVDARLEKKKKLGLSSFRGNAAVVKSSPPFLKLKDSFRFEKTF